MVKDFGSRASNLLFDLVHKIDNKELEKHAFVLKQLSEEINVSLEKVRR